MIVSAVLFAAEPPRFNAQGRGAGFITINSFRRYFFNIHNVTHYMRKTPIKRNNRATLLPKSCFKEYIIKVLHWQDFNFWGN